MKTTVKVPSRSNLIIKEDPICGVFIFAIFPLLAVICFVAFLFFDWPEAEKILARNCAIIFGGLSCITVLLASWWIFKAVNTRQLHYPSDLEQELK